MSKIKLVIEIPQEVHEHAKNTSEDRTDEYSAMRAIANGIPLDDLKEIYIGMDGNAVQIYPNNEVLNKIKAEIDEIQLSEPIMSTDGLYCYGSKSISMGHFREKVIDIIDKYREGSE